LPTKPDDARGGHQPEVRQRDRVDQPVARPGSRRPPLEMGDDHEGRTARPDPRRGRNPYVYRRGALRRLIAKAIHSGIAGERIGRKLCTVVGEQRHRTRHEQGRANLGRVAVMPRTTRLTLTARDARGAVGEGLAPVNAPVMSRGGGRVPCPENRCPSADAPVVDDAQLAPRSRWWGGHSSCGRARHSARRR